MAAKHPLRQLCCVTWATLLNICLDEEDLRFLGHWPEGCARAELPPEVLSRARLRHACHECPAELQRLGDHLDLQYLDTVLTVRALPTERLAELEHRWKREPDGQTALPGLLWALCSDERREARVIGVRLAHAALALATEAFVRGARAA